MLTLTIPDIDETLETRLRERAAANGHSVEEEARRIIDAGLPRGHETGQSGIKSLPDEIHDLFAPFGGVELDIPPRQGSSREPPTFD